MIDETEDIRRQLVKEINSNPIPRELRETVGQVWNTKELSRDFIVLGFMAPFVVVKRKSDGVKGSLEFQHSPRLYFNFKKD